VWQNLLLKKRNKRVLFWEVVFPTLLIYIQSISTTGGEQLTKAAFNYPKSLIDASYSTFAARSALEHKLCAGSQLCQPLFGGDGGSITTAKGAAVSMATALCRNVTADVAALLASSGDKNTPKAPWASPARCVEGDLVYADSSDLQSAATNLAYDNNIWGAVELNKHATTKGYSFTLRFPIFVGGLPATETKLQPPYQAVSGDQTSSYQSSGFLAMQWLVERCLGDASQCVGTAPHGTPYPPVRFASVPTPEVRKDTKLEGIFCMGMCGENSQPSKLAIAAGV